MQKIMIKIVLIFSLLVINIGCSSGGGNNSEPGDNFPGTGEGRTSLELSWEMPNQREDESLLPPEDIQGYVVVGFAKSKMEELINELEKNGSSLEYYRNNLSLIHPSISPSDVKNLIETGVDNAVIIHSASQTTLLIQDLPADTYYFAISTVDTENLVSKLSQSVEITVP
jgi:hypothetical protein